MTPELLKITLSIIMALESNNGTQLSHVIIKDPKSIHYGEMAIGKYGIMPATLRELKVDMDDERGARKLATAILRRNGHYCPLRTAVILWERGQNHKITLKSWEKGNAPQRLQRALKVWRGPIRRSEFAGRRFY